MIITLLISTFTTVFLAELGDKTQLTTLALSGSSSRPFAVFIGSASALILTSLIGALAGGSISTVIPENIMKGLASFIFLYIGSLLLWSGAKNAK